MLSLPAVSNQPRASRRHLAASSLAASTEQSRIVSISRPAVLHSHEIDVRTVVLLCSLLLLFRRQQPATTDQPQHRQSCSSTLSIAQHRCWKRPQPLTPLHVCALYASSGVFCVATRTHDSRRLHCIDVIVPAVGTTMQSSCNLVWTFVIFACLVLCDSCECACDL